MSFWWRLCKITFVHGSKIHLRLYCVGRPNEIFSRFSLMDGFKLLIVSRLVLRWKVKMSDSSVFCTQSRVGHPYQGRNSAVNYLPVWQLVFGRLHNYNCDSINWGFFEGSDSLLMVISLSQARHKRSRERWWWCRCVSLLFDVKLITSIIFRRMSLLHLCLASSIIQGIKRKTGLQTILTHTHTHTHIYTSKN